MNRAGAKRLLYSFRPIPASGTKSRQSSLLPPVTKRTLVFGDVQACADAFRKGLEIVRPQADDRLVILGDLVQNGPDSRGALETAREVKRAYPDTILIDGNHDEKHRRVRALQLAGNTERLSRIHWQYDRFLSAHAQLSDELLAWTGSFSLIETLEPNWVVVHAGIPPHINEPVETIKAKANDNRYSVLRVLTYLKPGTLKPYTFSEDQTDGIYWADQYDGRYGSILFGHQVHRKPTRYPWAIALDTGSGWGGRLSILELLPGESEPRIFSIATRDLSWREERLVPADADLRLNLQQLESGVTWD